MGKKGKGGLAGDKDIRSGLGGIGLGGPLSAGDWDNDNGAIGGCLWSGRTWSADHSQLERFAMGASLDRGP